ncbi:MAG: hypothetical protein K2X57_24695 [Xanthobacteraceae bacterium]|nr:hypothetical protein [Xanthobacteraceae bacterium]
MKFLFGLERATSASRGLTKIARGAFVKSNSGSRLIHLYTFDFAKTRLTRRVLGASLQMIRIYSVLVRLNSEPWFA